MKMPRSTQTLAFTALFLAWSAFAQAQGGPEHRQERIQERQMARELKMDRKLERREEKKQERKQERQASHPYLPDEAVMQREHKGEGLGRMSFEERRKLRRDINDAGRELYKPPPRD